MFSRPAPPKAIAPRSFGLRECPNGASGGACSLHEDRGTKGQAGQTRNGNVSVKVIPPQTDSRRTDSDIGQVPVRCVSKRWDQIGGNHKRSAIGQNDHHAPMFTIVECNPGVRSAGSEAISSPPGGRDLLADRGIGCCWPTIAR